MTLRESEPYQQFLKHLGSTTGWRLQGGVRIRRTDALGRLLCPIQAVFGIGGFSSSGFTSLDNASIMAAADFDGKGISNEWAAVRHDLLAACGLAGTEALDSEPKATAP